MIFNHSKFTINPPLKKRYFGLVFGGHYRLQGLGRIIGIIYLIILNIQMRFERLFTQQILLRDSIDRLEKSLKPRDLFLQVRR
jgi:hypothetical protein